MCIVTFCTYTCGHKVQQGELEPGALLLGLDCDRTVPRFLAGTTVNVCADCSLKNQMGTVVAAVSCCFVRLLVQNPVYPLFFNYKTRYYTIRS